MANGPVPKLQHQRERDTRRRQADSTVLHDDGVVRGPELVGSYLPETLEWWETWRTSPQAQLFQPTDWQRLKLIAPLVDKNYAAPSAAAVSEIRLNEERLGATIADRLRLKLRIETDGPVAVVTPIRPSVKDDVKARLGGARPTPQPREETPLDEPGF